MNVQKRAYHLQRQAVALPPSTPTRKRSGISLVSHR